MFENHPQAIADKLFTMDLFVLDKLVKKLSLDIGSPREMAKELRIKYQRFEEKCNDTQYYFLDVAQVYRDIEKLEVELSKSKNRIAKTAEENVKKFEEAIFTIATIFRTSAVHPDVVLAIFFKETFKQYWDLDIAEAAGKRLSDLNINVLCNNFGKYFDTCPDDLENSRTISNSFSGFWRITLQMSSHREPQSSAFIRLILGNIYIDLARVMACNTFIIDYFFKKNKFYSKLKKENRIPYGFEEDSDITYLLSDMDKHDAVLDKITNQYFYLLFALLTHIELLPASVKAKYTNLFNQLEDNIAEKNFELPRSKKLVSLKKISRFAKNIVLADLGFSIKVFNDALEKQLKLYSEKIDAHRMLIKKFEDSLNYTTVGVLKKLLSDKFSEEPYFNSIQEKTTPLIEEKLKVIPSSQHSQMQIPEFNKAILAIVLKEIKLHERKIFIEIILDAFFPDDRQLQAEFRKLFFPPKQFEQNTDYEDFKKLFPHVFHAENKFSQMFESKEHVIDKLQQLRSITDENFDTDLIKTSIIEDLEQIKEFDFKSGIRKAIKKADPKNLEEMNAIKRLISNKAFQFFLILGECEHYLRKNPVSKLSSDINSVTSSVLVKKPIVASEEIVHTLQVSEKTAKEEEKQSSEKFTHLVKSGNTDNDTGLSLFLISRDNCGYKLGETVKTLQLPSGVSFVEIFRDYILTLIDEAPLKVSQEASKQSLLPSNSSSSSYYDDTKNREIGLSQETLREIKMFEAVNDKLSLLSGFPPQSRSDLLKKTFIFPDYKLYRLLEDSPHTSMDHKEFTEFVFKTFCSTQPSLDTETSNEITTSELDKSENNNSLPNNEPLEIYKTMSSVLKDRIEKLANESKEYSISIIVLKNEQQLDSARDDWKERDENNKVLFCISPSENTLKGYFMEDVHSEIEVIPLQLNSKLSEALNNNDLNAIHTEFGNYREEILIYNFGVLLTLIINNEDKPLFEETIELLFHLPIANKVIQLLESESNHLLDNALKEQLIKNAILASPNISNITENASDKTDSSEKPYKVEHVLTRQPSIPPMRLNRNILQNSNLPEKRTSKEDQGKTKDRKSTDSEFSRFFSQLTSHITSHVPHSTKQGKSPLTPNPSPSPKSTQSSNK